MHFYRYKGKQAVDLRGNLILSKNPELMSAVGKSAAPRIAHGAKAYVDLENNGFFVRLAATVNALAFIWGKSK